MIKITQTLFLNPAEIKMTFIRSPGPGGQNVNKLATGVQLRFNVLDSALPEAVKLRMLSLYGTQITRSGDLIIKAIRFRTQLRNKEDAIERLILLLKSAAFQPKKRKKTKPSSAVRERRLESKKTRGKVKALRKIKLKKEYDN